MNFCGNSKVKFLHDFQETLQKADECLKYLFQKNFKEVATAKIITKW